MEPARNFASPTIQARKPGRFSPKGAEDSSPGLAGGVGVGRAASAKGARTRRSWSQHEEEVLLSALMDLVNNGWKSDNGFRSGYLTRVHEAMKREFPNTDIKMQPHLQSKINTWKRCYYSLDKILGRSGVGFCNFKIECDDDQWAQIVKADSDARYMRHKAWPYLEDWKLIYGKDRVAGGLAEGMGEASKKLNSTPPVTTESPIDEVDFSLDDFYTQEQIQESLNPENGTESCNKSVKSPSSMKKLSHKRKSGGSVDAILEAMMKMNDDTNERLQTLSTRIGYDFDLSAKQTEVSQLLDNIPMLTKKHKFRACDILVKEPERLNLFLGMSEYDKEDYVMHILEEIYGV